MPSDRSILNAVAGDGVRSNVIALGRRQRPDAPFDWGTDAFLADDGERVAVHLTLTLFDLNLLVCALDGSDVQMVKDLGNKIRHQLKDGQR